MQIIVNYPPNIDKIDNAFNARGKPVVFTYGNIIFNPLDGEVTRDLLKHEETHMKQQGSDIEGWWDRYIKDKDFRLKQELEAYRNQYNFIKNSGKNWNYVSIFLSRIATDLSSEIYGNIISYDEAMRLIKNS